MSGLLPPPAGTGGGGEEGYNSGALPEKRDAGSPSETRNLTDRKHLFGTPTSQLSSSTDLSSSGDTAERRPSVSDMGMSPVRDSVGKLVHLRKEGSQPSEDIQQDDGQNSPSDRPIPQSDKGEPSRDGEEEEKKGKRWDSTRARLGSVLSARQTIRESLSRTRQKSADPKVDHLMNDLNSRESVSRADLKPPSPHGSGHQSPPPPNVTAATSLAGSTLPVQLEQASVGIPSNTSPSRFSNRFASWRNHRRERGRELPQDQEELTDPIATERIRSASSPPPQKFRVRVNRFLRSGKRSVSPTVSPTSGVALVPVSGQPGSSASTPNAQTPQYLSSAESSTVRGSPKPGSGFRKAVRRGVTSARRRMSAPFISTPPRSGSTPVSGPVITEPPERPQTVPLEKSGPLRTPGGSQFVLSNEPGHGFLPSEATNVKTSSPPPIIAENPAAEEWLERDFEEVPMIQSRPPMFPPGMEESPPMSPWVKAGDGSKQWLELTSVPPRLPEIASIAPFAVDELMAREFATANAPSGGQNLSDIYWAIAPDSSIDKIDDGNTTDKGKGKFAPGITDHLKPPEESNYLESSSGKSIEVLEEEQRRKSRDTGIMGLDPEVRNDPPTMSGPGEEDDEGEFTYASAVREIAGLDRFPKRPPPDDDANLDDVSVPLPECDYDLPLPSFRFSMLAEPPPSSNEADASPFAAPPSPTQETPSSASDFSRLAFARTQIATTATTTTTTTRTTTAASTSSSASASFSPPSFDPCHYQMLLSSKRPYMFVLQELSSGTYVKITPQTNSSPVSRSLSTVSQSYPETPAPSQTSTGPARSPVSVRFVNGNGLLARDGGVHEEEDEDGDEAEGSEKKGSPKENGR